MKKYTYYSLKKRLFALFLATVFIFLSLAVRLAVIQAIDFERLQVKANSQWTRDIPYSAQRGLILDRNGVLLAGNDTVFDVYARPKGLADAAFVSQKLAKLFGLDCDALLKKLSNRNVSEVTVAKNIDEKAAETLESMRIEGVYITRANKRVYKYGDLLSQVLGFVSSDNVGQSGLEKYYNDYLRGIDGQLLTQADLQGVEIDGALAYYSPATDGLTLTLTVDATIQAICENLTEQAMLLHSPKSAHMLVMNVNTGEVIAMSNKPSLDLNDLPRDDLALLNANSRNTLVIDIYEPGSTFKIFTMAANVEEFNRGNKNAFSTSHVFTNGSRTRTVDGQTIKCWSDHANGKHSNQTLSDALNNSCNPIFVDIALAIGKKTLYDYIEAFGFGKVTGIDFLGEQGGILVAEDILKNCDLARVGFGQTIAVTPIQMLTAGCCVVNGGTLLKPYLVGKISSSDGTLAERFYPTEKTRVLSRDTSRIMRDMLASVVSFGSGKNAKIEGWTVGGKTGTAQKYEDGAIASGKYISSFMGFFPMEKPEYAAMVIIDEPEGQHYGSTVAAPYCRSLFEQIIQYEIMEINQ